MAFRKFPSLFLVAVILLGGGFLAGFFWSFEPIRQTELVMEIKILHQVLQDGRNRAAGDLFYGDFVLARYYRLLHRLPVEKGAELAEDFGPVDVSRIQGVPVDKTLGNPDLDYLHIKELLKKRR